jgi:anti-anti-sigma factor
MFWIKDPAMVIDFEQHDDVGILCIHGRVASGSDVDYLSNKASEIRESRCAKLLVDLNEVPSIGSMGIGFVVGLYTSIHKVPGGRFVLAGANSRVREVLDLMRLSTVIPLAEDVNSGLAFLSR